jgi:thiol-disulfide isomerase/thioredoxin
MIIDILKNKNFIILVLIIFLIGLLFAITYFQKNDNNVNDVNNTNNMEIVESSTIVCKNSPVESFGNSPKPIINNTLKKMQFKVFYTNWCGWSKKALQLLDSQDFKDKMKEVEDMAEIVKVDCETDGKEECKQKEINGYPTMILYKNVNGVEKPIEFNGARTADGIVTFIKENA